MLKKRRYMFLTIGWAASLLVAAVGEDSMVLRLLNPLLFSALALAGVVGVSGVTRHAKVAGAFGAIWVIGLWAIAFGASLAIMPIMMVVGILFIGTVALFTVRDFLRAKEITADVLWGAVGVYLLLATAMALVFTTLSLLMPGSFSVDLEIQDALYFSFATMTTLGYGDITPISGTARLLASFTAIGGVMYTGVVVARLVALELASQLRRDPASDSATKR